MAEQKATTDEYGTASVDFELPKEGQTGQYSISVNGTATEYVRVEEYKRPTFEITFPKVNEKYNPPSCRKTIPCPFHHSWSC